MYRRALPGLTIVSACLLLNACATMYVRGNKLRRVEAQGNENVPLRVLNFDRATRDLRIFEGDTELEIQGVPDNVMENNFRSYLNQERARQSAKRSCLSVCEYNWADVSELGPGLWLDSRRPHTLRFVRNGQEAVVTIKASFRPKWIFANWVWFAFAPVGWVVDGATGSWKEYPRLDIDQLFREARGSNSGGSRAVAATTVAMTSPVAAPYYGDRRPTPFYFTGGIGGGNFTPVCDTGCFGDALSANNVTLAVGWALSGRLRLEGAVQYQAAAGDAGQGSHASSASVGVAAYPLGHLFVRGGVSHLALSVVDSVGVTEGKGGPGFTVGLGYDVFLSRTFAITPYANYFRGTIKNLEYSTVSTVTTSGSVSALNAGVSFTYRPWRARP